MKWSWREQAKNGTTIREIYRHHWTRFDTPEGLKAAAGVLEDHGWIRVEYLKTGGRSTTRVRLHPTLKGVR